MWQKGEGRGGEDYSRGNNDASARDRESGVAKGARHSSEGTSDIVKEAVEHVVQASRVGHVPVARVTGLACVSGLYAGHDCRLLFLQGHDWRQVMMMLLNSQASECQTSKSRWLVISSCERRDSSFPAPPLTSGGSLQVPLPQAHRLQTHKHVSLP